MHGTWDYDHDAREWTRNYADGSLGVVCLDGGQWRGTLTFQLNHQRIGQWKDSKTAKRDLDRSQRERAATVAKVKT